MYTAPRNIDRLNRRLCQGCLTPRVWNDQMTRFEPLFYWLLHKKVRMEVLELTTTGH